MIKKIKRIAVATTFCTTLCGVTAVSAGVFDQLVNAANGALAGYGRDGRVADRLDLSLIEIEAGLREALLAGSANVVSQIGTSNGYYQDSSIKIRLPDNWNKARRIAERIGYNGDFDELERKLNQVAEEAAPATHTIVAKAVAALEMSDARAILNSDDVAASRFLRSAMSSSIASGIRPVIRKSLDQIGAIRTSQRISKKVSRLPMVGTLDLDLAEHVISKSIDGFFYYLGKEEEAIRNDPSRRISPLLQKVFG